MTHGGQPDDRFIEIQVCSANKVGDGMGAYLVYKIITKTNLGFFKKGEFFVLFEQAAQNAVEAAEALAKLFGDFTDVENKVRDIHAIEHQRWTVDVDRSQSRLAVRCIHAPLRQAER